MESKNDKIKHTFHQGNGRDALDLRVQVTQEELDKMEQIRISNPDKWQGKDLELLQEARSVIKEQTTQNSKNKPSAGPIEEAGETKEGHKKRNNGLWWTLGIMAALFLIIRAINYTLEKQNAIAMQKMLNGNYESVGNNPQKTDDAINGIITHQGITVEFPDNWRVWVKDTFEDSFEIKGRNEHHSFFTVMWSTNEDRTLEQHLNDWVSITKNDLLSDTKKEVEHSTFYKTNINGIDALAVDITVKYPMRTRYEQDFVFENDKYSVLVSMQADSISYIENDFNVMKNSIRFSDSNKSDTLTN